MKSQIIKGLPLSQGVVLGFPLFFLPNEEQVPEYLLEEHQIENEINRYRYALISSKQEIKTLQDKLSNEGLKEIVSILETHLQMLQDPFLTEGVEEKIRSSKKNPEAVFTDSLHAYTASFNKESLYFQERVQDVTDISKRILTHLLDKNPAKNIPPDSIVLIEELFPSFIAEAHPHVKGFISQLGGITSHAAIIARARGIPYIAGVNTAALQQERIESLLIDGTSGELIINPEKEKIDTYVQQNKKKQISIQKSTQKSKTKDGVLIELLGNLEQLENIHQLIDNGAKGIGLFRSEYLFFLNKNFPDEDSQFEAYKKIVEKMPGKEVVIRIFDIGADKMALSSEIFSQIRKESNPALGCRAVRFLLQHPELFKTQLRALMRASIYGNLQLLLPMISDLDEIREIKKLIEEVKKELSFSHHVPLGCMIEVPSMAILVEALTKEVDFLSIGTSDLTQYLLAVDRTNPNVNHLYAKAHPALFIMIAHIVKVAKQADKPLILCGEVANNILYLPMLIGLGVNKFSVGAKYIPLLKEAIASLHYMACHDLAQKALQYDSSEELFSFLQAFNPSAS